MYIRKERLDSSIGWTSSMSPEDLSNDALVNEKILSFIQSHTSIYADSIFSDWGPIREALPQMPTFEINANNEVIRTFYWNDEDQYLAAKTIMDSCDDEFIAAGNSLTYDSVLIEDYTE